MLSSAVVVRRPLVIPLLIAGLLGACGGSAGGGGASSSASAPPSGSSGAKPSDACKLITSADVTAALGEAVDAPKSDSFPVPSCSYGATNGAGPADGIFLQIQDISLFDKARRSAGQLGFTVEAASGIGDDAYFEVPQQQGTALDLTLNVKRGNTMLDVTVRHKGYANDQLKAGETQLAKAALTRV